VLTLTLLCSCSDEKTRAQHKLQKAGIPLNAGQIMLAVQHHDESVLHDLLECGVHPNHCDDEGRSPLMVSVEHSDHRSTMLLLRAGAQLDSKSPKHVSPLAIAAKNGDISIARALLEQGANPNTLSENEEPLLVWCINHGRYVIARALLENGANPRASRSDGASALNCAAIKKQIELSVQLLELGAEPEKRGASTGATNPLIIQFVENGWDELLPKLVQNGADLKMKSINGQSAVDIALSAGNRERFQLLLKLGADEVPGGWEQRLRNSIDSGHSQQLDILLDAGIKSAMLDEKGRSLLDVSIEKQDLVSAEVLLRHHAGIGTSYHFACEHGNTAAVKLLEKHGVIMPDEGMAGFDVPIHCAIRSGNSALVEHLLERGADIGRLGRDNQTPLVCAIARRQSEIVKLLLERKADPNTKLEPRVTDSFLACVDGAGMKWYLRNDRNLTPLMIAADSGDLETTKALLDHGAKTDTWTAVNKTWPLNFASRKNDVKMMRLLLRKDPENEERKIIVSLTKQLATVFDSEGETLYSTKVSTGKKGYSTPTGVYVITNKHREWHSSIYNDASMPCFQRLSCSAFGFHQGVVPGYPASHGCLRVPAGNAQKLFALTEIGDRVTIEP